MTMEYKNISVAGLKSDDDNGIVTAIVSVTGIRDNVNDIIEPGAYTKTLAARKPKGVWHHSWVDPIAKTVDVKELMPGDPELPSELPNGQPWPQEAGAVQVKMQFNLDGARGKQAYSDVKFFADEQEWSIGYNVPTGMATVEQKSGIRRIKELDWYEYSPVLFGAMPNARTQGGVKEAQLAFKMLGGSQFTKDAPENVSGGVGLIDDEESAELRDELDELLAAIDPEDFEIENDGEKSLRIERKGMGMDPKKIQAAIDALKALLDDEGQESSPDDEYSEGEKAIPTAFIELKAMEYESLADCLDSAGLDGYAPLKKAVARFDAQVKTNDDAEVEAAAEDVLTALEDLSDEDEDGEKSDAIALIGSTLGNMLKTGGEEKSLKERRAAYLEAMPEGDFAELDTYVGTTRGNTAIKSAVDHEAGQRIMTGSDLNWQPHVRTKAMKPKPKKNVSAMRRQRATDAGHAMPDGSFPIENAEDLKNAIQACGRAKDPEAAKAWIKKRAKELGAEDMLPASWQEKALIPLSEFKDLGIDVETILSS